MNPSSVAPGPVMLPGASIRDRILDAFAVRARKTGIRGVAMGDIAADLGVSKRTLYQHFESKDVLVHALVERFIARMKLRGAQNLDHPVPPAEMLRRFAERWTENLGSFSPEFWQELERDQPSSHALLRDMMNEVRRRAGSYLRRHFRAEVHGAVAGELLLLAIRHFNDATVSERLGLTRSTALAAALDLWAGGALDPARAAEASGSGEDEG